METELINYNNVWSLIAARKRSKAIYDEYIKTTANNTKNICHNTNGCICKQKNI